MGRHAKDSLWRTVRFSTSTIEKVSEYSRSEGCDFDTSVEDLVMMGAEAYSKKFAKEMLKPNIDMTKLAPDNKDLQ